MSRRIVDDDIPTAQIDRDAEFRRVVDWEWWFLRLVLYFALAASVAGFVLADRATSAVCMAVCLAGLFAGAKRRDIDD